MFTLAIDPGTTVLGWALFYDKELRLSGESLTIEVDPARQCIEHSHNLRVAIQKDRVNAVVVEYMEHRSSDSKSQANDLIKVNFVGGFLAGVFSASPYVLRPSRWKGSIPKGIHQKHFLSLLSKEEAARVDRSSHARDAIGIGLYHVGRSTKTGSAR